MMSAVKGDEKRIQAEPFVIFYAEPVTPLKHPKRIPPEASSLCIKGDSGPLRPCPHSRLTAPITSAGAFAVGVAESLAGLVLGSNPKRKGSPFICGGGAGVMDMRTTIRPYAAPEQDLGRVFRTEIARFLNLPSWGSGGTKATQSSLMSRLRQRPTNRSFFLL